MSKITSRHLLPAAVALAFVLTGCTSTPDVSVATLTQHNWSLVDATDADGHADTALRGGNQAPIQLSFQADRLGVTNSCNGMGGNYQLKNDQLEIGDLMQTMMACESELMARESAIKSRLQQPLRVKYDQQSSRLTLTNDAGVMVFQPAPR
ncbi:MAG: META domain-containing protein [Pseudomonas sp.]